MIYPSKVQTEEESPDAVFVEIEPHSSYFTTENNPNFETKKTKPPLL